MSDELWVNVKGGCRGPVRGTIRCLAGGIIKTSLTIAGNLNQIRTRDRQDTKQQYTGLYINIWRFLIFLTSNLA
jgi:hypothetical protein